MSSLRISTKPAPVFAEHRPLYKAAQLVLILQISSRGNRSSLARLQLFNWALKRPEREKFLEAAAESAQLSINGWGFDPAVPIALRFAIADGLIEDIPTGYQLTTGGEIFARAVIENSLLKNEFVFLQRVSKKITEAMVTSVARSWEN